MKPWPSPSLPMLPGEGRQLRLYDSASGELRPTAPGSPAGLYVCGITPYDATHIGHAATFLAFDLVQRVWLDAGTAVRYVQNVTDVDDPLLERAAANGEDWQELAAREIARFIDDMTELRMLAPDHLDGVVEEMPTVVTAVEELRDSGALYELDGDWYFDITADPRFGAVANLSMDEMIALSSKRGGDPDRAGKRHPLDALVWRSERAGEPSWPSALGPGRPGWHIECASLALDRLGPGFDVQGGGGDLAFPHHELSAAQGYVLSGQWPYARTYSHAGMVAYQGEKMSKSLGNLVFVSDLRQTHDPMAIRLALLAHRYRDDWEWTDDGLAQAEERLAAWRRAVSWPTGPSAARVLDDVRARLADDLDTPGALTVVDRWAEEQRLRGGDDPAAPGIVSRMSDALLGVAL